MSESNDKDLVSRGETNGVGYTLEIRVMEGLSPYTFGDMIVDSTWRHIGTIIDKHGVPNHMMSPEIASHGILNYDTAMSLAYKVLCADWRTLCEVRLVKCAYKVTHLITRSEELPPIQPSWCKRK